MSKLRFLISSLLFSVFGVGACQTVMNSLRIPSNDPVLYSQTAFSEKDFADWEHLSIGINFIPYTWLGALNSVMFLDDKKESTLPILSTPVEMLRRYGLQRSTHMQTEFLGAKKSYLLPFAGLTVAWTDHVSQPAEGYVSEDQIVREIKGVKSVKMVGANCALCHQNDLRTIQGPGHVLGAPSFVSPKAMIGDMYLSVLALFVMPDRMEAFLQRVKEQNPQLTDLDPYRDARSLHMQFKKDVGEVTLPQGAFKIDQLIKSSGFSKISNLFVERISELPVLDNIFKKIKVADLSDATYYWTLFSAKEFKDKTSVSKIQTPLVNSYVRLVRLTHGIKEGDRIGDINDIAKIFAQKITGRMPAIKETPFLFGRADAFSGVGNSYIRGDRPVDATAPVSFPWIWGVKYMAMKHYTANMNSTLHRNIGAVLGVGASYSTSEGRTTVNVANLNTLEDLMHKIDPPEWKGVFASMQNDRDYVVNEDPHYLERGKNIYQSKCMSCHEMNQFVGPAGNLRNYTVYPLIEVGTDPQVVLNIRIPVGEESFSKAAMRSTDFQRDLYYARAGTSNADKEKYSRESLYGKDFIRDTYLGFNEQAKYNLDFGNIKPGNGYKARHLAGVWATAPYLHNNSVPTLYELLLPSTQRPQAFILRGDMIFDPVRLGIQTNRYQGSCPKTQNNYENCLNTVDSKVSGNGRAGHEGEAYGTNLSDPDRMALLNYLKVLPAEPEYRQLVK